MDYTKDEQLIACRQMDDIINKSYNVLWHLSFRLIFNYLRYFQAPYRLQDILCEFGYDQKYMDIVLAESTIEAMMYILASYIGDYPEPNGTYYCPLTYNPEGVEYWYMQINIDTNKTHLVDLQLKTHVTLPDIYSLNKPTTKLQRWYIEVLYNMLTYPYLGNLIPPQQPLFLESPESIKKMWPCVTQVWKNIWEINPMARSSFNGQSYLLVNDLLDSIMKVEDASIRETGTKMLLDFSLSTKMVHPVTSLKCNRISVVKIIKAVGTSVCEQFISNIVDGGILCYHILLDFNSAYKLLPQMNNIINRYMQINIQGLHLASKDFLGALYDSYYDEY